MLNRAAATGPSDGALGAGMFGGRDRVVRPVLCHRATRRLNRLPRRFAGPRRPPAAAAAGWGSRQVRCCDGGTRVGGAVGGGDASRSSRVDSRCHAGVRVWPGDVRSCGARDRRSARAAPGRGRPPGTARRARRSPAGCCRIGDETLAAAAVAAGALNQLQSAGIDEQRTLVDVADGPDGDHDGRAGVAAGEGEDVADRHDPVTEPQPVHGRWSCRRPAATSLPTCSTHRRSPSPSTRSWGSPVCWRRRRDTRTWNRPIARIRPTRIR